MKTKVDLKTEEEWRVQTKVRGLSKKRWEKKDTIDGSIGSQLLGTELTKVSRFKG